ncbi:hypothetical protein J2D73_07095 [Acetobacter sacchari]|nr:hypothetical protein [Acetobacter sacchari]
MQQPRVAPSTKRANIIRTRKYFAVICRDEWGGSHFSPDGSSIAIPIKQVSAIWIGNNLRQALLTSHDYRADYGYGPLFDERLQEARPRSAAASRNFWFGIRDEYGFKDHLAAMSKSALAFVDWDYEETDQIRLRASRGRGGGHSAWYSHENHAKVFHVSINVTDEELGTVALQALDACQPNYA